MDLHGVAGGGTSGNRIFHISNHFSTLCFSWFFLRFCFSSSAHWTSLMPSRCDGSPVSHGSARRRCWVRLLIQMARSELLKSL